MMPERYRRLWRRRMRRRPLLPLLVVAFLAVDVVLAFSDVSKNLLAAGFLLGQMSLIAVWAVVSPRGVLTKASLGVFGLIALIQLFFRISDNTDAVLGPVLLMVFGGKFVAAALVMVGLRWFQPGLRPMWRWRFSIGTLLMAGLLIALLATLLRRGDWAPITDLRTWEFVGGETIVISAMTMIAVATRGTLRTLLLTLLPTAGLLVATVGVPDKYAREVLQYSFAQALTMGVWMAVFLVKRRRAARPTAPSGDSPTEQEPDDTPATLRMRIDVEA